jgi:Bacterial tandem repeat domain 1
VSTRVKFVLLAVLSLLMTTIVLNPVSNVSAVGESDAFRWYGTTYKKSSSASSQYALHGWLDDHLTGHINETAQNGYRLTDIGAYYVPNGGADPIRYDVTFDKTYKAQKYELSVRLGQLITLNFDYVKQGFRMVFVRAHMVGTFPHFSAIWEQDGDGSFIVAASHQSVIDRDNYLRTLGYSLEQVDVLPWENGQNIYNAIWKKGAPSTGWYWGYKWADYITLRDQQAAAGWEPIQVHAYDIDHSAGVTERYDILFRPKVSSQPRIFDYTYSLDNQLNDIAAKRAEGYGILTQQRVVNVIR